METQQTQSFEQAPLLKVTSEEFGVTFLIFSPPAGEKQKWIKRNRKAGADSLVMGTELCVLTPTNQTKEFPWKPEYNDKYATKMYELYFSDEKFKEDFLVQTGRALGVSKAETLRRIEENEAFVKEQEAHLRKKAMESADGFLGDLEAQLTDAASKIDLTGEEEPVGKN